MNLTETYKSSPIQEQSHFVSVAFELTLSKEMRDLRRDSNSSKTKRKTAKYRFNCVQIRNVSHSAAVGFGLCSSKSGENILAKTFELHVARMPSANCHQHIQTEDEACTLACVCVSHMHRELGSIWF